MNDKIQFRKIIGSRLREARNRAGLTQKQVADILQIDVRNISDRENGKSNMSLDRLQEHTEALGVSPLEILEDPAQQNSEILEEFLCLSERDRSLVQSLMKEMLKRP